MVYRLAHKPKIISVKQLTDQYEGDCSSLLSDHCYHSTQLPSLQSGTAGRGEY